MRQKHCPLGDRAVYDFSVKTSGSVNKLNVTKANQMLAN